MKMSNVLKLPGEAREARGAREAREAREADDALGG